MRDITLQHTDLEINVSSHSIMTAAFRSYLALKLGQAHHREYTHHISHATDLPML